MSTSMDGAHLAFGYFLEGDEPVVPAGPDIELIALYTPVGGGDPVQRKIEGFTLRYRLRPWSPVRELDLPKAHAYALVDADRPPCVGRAA